jgi:putative FmdB family regulatory protein
MPTYLYECPTHGEFEEFHSMSKMLEVCPKCQEAGLAEPKKLKQLINCLSKGTVELYGQELVDKLKGDAQQIKKDIAKSDKAYANLLGDDKYHALQTRMDRQRKEKR